MPPLPQTYVLPSLKSLTILRASVSEETGSPSGHWRLNLSFPKPSLAQPPATIMGRGRAGRFYQALLYLGSLGLIFLLGTLYRLQVVSGTVIVHEFPAPLGNSFLTQSQERGPWYSLFGGQDVGNRVSNGEARFLSYYQILLSNRVLCQRDLPHYLERVGVLRGRESRGQFSSAPGSLHWIFFSFFFIWG